MDITPLQNNQVDSIWFKAKEYFELAAEHTHGRFTANDIRHTIRNGNKQLWVAHEGEEIYGVAVTSFINYPQLRALAMDFTGGRDFDKWHEKIMDAFREFAKVNGCEVLEAHGRAGWAKVFKQEGYKKRFDVFEMPVEIK